MIRRTPTVAVVAAVLIVASAACGGGGHPRAKPRSSTTASSTSTRASTSTTRPRPVLAPLTGLPDATGATRTRPALTVKIENLSLSHPQSGIELADLVYEEVVECNITRLVAVFQSRVPPVVGPVRSVRNTDQALVRPLRGIFVFSGGAAISLRSIATAPVVRFDESSADDAMFRDPSRGRPHNLYLRGPQIYARAHDAKGPPPAEFTYRQPGAPAVGGTPATHVVVRMSQDSSYDVTWDWDPASRTWLRSIFGRPDVTKGGTRVAAANVVVHPVHYVNRLGGDCGDEGAEADLAAPATVTILTGGRAVPAQWTQPDPTRPGVLRDAQGHPVALAPGATWVELPKPGVSITTT